MNITDSDMTAGVVLPLGKNAKDISGQKFGLLLVLGVAGRSRRRDVLWKCLCEDGVSVIVSGVSLRSGATKSCGCLHRRIITRHGLSKSQLYKLWISMWQRCTNPNASGYENYGGRGIKVCERWKIFENFVKDMGDRPSGCSLDRIDNNGNYEPGNCRWSTQAEQCRNTRQNRWITFRGETLLISDWAKRLGVKTYHLCHRFSAGWSVERTLTQPFNRRYFTKSNPCPWG